MADWTTDGDSTKLETPTLGTIWIRPRGDRFEVELGANLRVFDDLDGAKAYAEERAYNHEHSKDRLK